MVKNQTEFNNKYSKKIEEIELEDKKFEGQLVVEDYSELKELYLHSVKNIEKLTLRNLTQLQECTIWDCRTKELVIENCPRIKILNIRSNLLSSLEFLKFLPNLEELEADNNNEINSGLEYLPESLKKFSYENTNLVKTLKPYKGDWKACQKDIQELIKLLNKIPQKLLNNIVDTNSLINLEEKYQQLKKTIGSLLKEKTEEIETLEQKTKKIELEEEQNEILTAEILEKISNLKKTNQELMEKFTPFEQVYLKIEQKKENLEKLKKEIIAKNNLEDEIDLEELNELLEKQKFIVENNHEGSRKKLEIVKRRILRAKIISEKEITELCSLQSQIIQLQSNFNQRENQLNQVINNYYNQGFIISGSHNTLTNPSVHDNTLETITYEEETELQTAIEAPLPPKQLEK